MHKYLYILGVYYKMNELKTSVKKRASNKKYDDLHYKTITYKSKISYY